MTLLLLVLVVGLAGNQLVEVLHHGSVFLPLRKFAAAKRSSSNKTDALLGELFTCPFCMAHHACLLMSLFAVLLLPLSLWQCLLALPVMWFASTKVATLVNDYTHSVCRGPKDDVVVEDVEVQPQEVAITDEVTNNG